LDKECDTLDLMNLYISFRRGRARASAAELKSPFPYPLTVHQQVTVPVCPRRPSLSSLKHILPARAPLSFHFSVAARRSDPSEGVARGQSPALLYRHYAVAQEADHNTSLDYFWILTLQLRKRWIKRKGRKWSSCINEWVTNFVLSHDYLLCCINVKNLLIQHFPLGLLQCGLQCVGD
jgi:hypothetical protein